jgi:hypothetical protein
VGAAGLALCTGAYFTTVGRRLLLRVIDPSVARLMIGCAIGVLIGMPTVLRQYEFLLLSMDMYSSGYRDVTHMSMPFAEHLRWYLNFYFGVIAPDALVRGLLAAGVALALIRRDRRVLPIVAGAFAFFVSKPMSLIPAPHHVILWLPFFAIIAGYPVAAAAEWWPTRWRGRTAVAPLGVGLLLVALVFFTTLGPRSVSEVSKRDIERLDNVEHASDWLKHNTDIHAIIAVSYFCFNADVFYTWIRSLEVPVPSFVLDGRNYIIWWGYGSALRGKTGYACATREDIRSIKTRIDEVSPGEGTDPFSDVRFRPLHTFGTGSNEVTLFSFDYR